MLDDIKNLEEDLDFTKESLRSVNKNIVDIATKMDSEISFRDKQVKRQSLIELSSVKKDLVHEIAVLERKIKNRLNLRRKRKLDDLHVAI